MPVSVAQQQPLVNVPEIVATASFIGKNTALAASTIYTAAADGVYQLDYYCAASATGVAAITPQVLFTDDFLAQSVNMNPTQSGFGQANSQVVGGSFVFKAKGGTNIQIATLLGSGTAPTYNLYATLVQL